jgi:hypothetical protein
LVEGRGRTSIVARCHQDKDDAVVNVTAVMMATTQSLVAMALTAAQNKIQQMKGTNKRGDSIGDGDGNGIGNSKGNRDSDGKRQWQGRLQRQWQWRWQFLWQHEDNNNTIFGSNGFAATQNNNH